MTFISGLPLSEFATWFRILGKIRSVADEFVPADKDSLFRDSDFDGLSSVVDAWPIKLES